MKKLFSIIIAVLALNFLVVAGFVGWLSMGGKINRHKLADIRKIIWPVPAPVAPTTRPSTAATRPSEGLDRLDALLARHSGYTAGDQIQFLQQKYDAQQAELDRRQREIEDLKDQVDRAQAAVDKDLQRVKLQQTQVTQAQQQQQQAASDQGFQDSLNLYQIMPAKQVKTIFMTLPDTTVAQYLRALPPRNAGKIIKEFKSPQDLARIEKIMETLRQMPDTAQAAAPAQ